MDRLQGGRVLLVAGQSQWHLAETLVVIRQSQHRPGDATARAADRPRRVAVTEVAAAFSTPLPWGDSPRRGMTRVRARA
jgi:hypothetical protein